MHALINMLPGVPAVPGVPALNPANLRPVYPLRPEPSALEHWLFGGGADSLVGLKGRSLAPASAMPAFAANYLATVPDGLNGLISTIVEPGVYTQCAVIRYDAVSADRRIIFGTAQGGSGDGRGIMLDNRDNWGFNTLARPNASATGMPQGALTLMRDQWIFFALSVDVVANKWRCWVGGSAQTVEVTPASQYLPSTRGLALGNAYYTASAPNTFRQSLAVAEMIVFSEYVSPAALSEIYARSKERMASRGIVVY